MNRREVSLDPLKEPFRSGVRWLEFELQRRKIFMTRWETLRNESRQNYLRDNGASKAVFGDSPHNYGLAVDYVLDTSKVASRIVKSGDRIWRHKWDYESPAAVHVWDLFGEVVEAIGFEWGGRWTSPYDPPHVQMPNWRHYAGL